MPESIPKATMKVSNIRENLQIKEKVRENRGKLVRELGKIEY